MQKLNHNHPEHQTQFSNKDRRIKYKEVTNNFQIKFMMLELKLKELRTIIKLKTKIFAGHISGLQKLRKRAVHINYKMCRQE